MHILAYQLIGAKPDNLRSQFRPQAPMLACSIEKNEDISSLSLAMVCQYLAYFTALEKKTDIDKPRNLAKSVTVE